MSVSRGHPFQTGYLLLNYSGNPGVTDESYKGKLEPLGVGLLFSKDGGIPELHDIHYATSSVTQTKQVSLSTFAAAGLQLETVPIQQARVWYQKCTAKRCWEMSV